MAEPAETFTAFAGQTLLKRGDKVSVALAVKRAQAETTSAVLVFEDESGRQVDFDLRGSDDDISERLSAPTGPPAEARRPGRPKLGVVAREVTLLPRHWDWLSGQRGGASVTLRRLVDAARSAEGDGYSVSRAQQAADAFMTAMLGNQPGYEDASRALYARDLGRFHALTEPWPQDPRDHARSLAGRFS